LQGLAFSKSSGINVYDLTAVSPVFTNRHLECEIFKILPLIAQDSLAMKN
jgi:hypothetical protein